MAENSVSRFSRRSFAAALGGAAAVSALVAQDEQPGAPAPTVQRPSTLPESAPFERTLAFVRKEVAPKLMAFPMTDVRLTPSVYKDAQDWNRDYLRRLPQDRLVHNFRVNAGLPSSAKPFGGWEEPKCELRGHFTGHYLSAAALLCSSTGDRDIKVKADAIVDELAKCQAKLGGGYLSAFPREFWDRLEARKPVWAPFYTIHKIMAGMLDQYVLAGNRQALDVLQGMSQWADEWTASKSEAQMQNILNTEYGGMNEVLYSLAAVSGDDRWAKVGDRFTKKRFFNPLALRRDDLQGLHVNTHIPQVIGAARRYEMSGDMRFHDVADYFWSEVVSARTYATGGTSNKEGWLVPPRQLAAELKRGAETAECCCSYNMLKLTRHLYSWTGDPRYFDYYERALLNHRIGTIHPRNGHTQYYLSLTPGAFRTFNTEDDSFWCCTGTGIEEYAKLNDSIYWHDGRGLYINLFIPSELHWREKNFRIRQETSFPEVAGAAFVVGVKEDREMPIHLRIPQWTQAGGSLKINGKMADAFAGPGGYLTIDRIWRNGDKLELSLPMGLRSESMPDDPSIQAFFYGPVVLAGDFGSMELGPSLTEGPSGPQMWKVAPLTAPSAEFVPPTSIPAEGDRPERKLPAQMMPMLRVSNPDPNSFLKPEAEPLTFRTTGQEKDLTLRPFNRLLESRYSVYFQVS